MKIFDFFGVIIYNYDGDLNMYRYAMNDLILWKNKKNRKPLLLYGARQVGKTYLVKEFGEKHFKDVIYVNFETNDIVGKIIDENIDPFNIIKNLEIVFGKKIDKDNTLIFFDEIQRNTRALTSLKYFCENAPEYYVIGAGSLLGVHINKKEFSFPVGKVDFLTIYPLSFKEFLYNTNNNLLIDKIQNCFDTNKPIDNAMHEKALELYYDYLCIGGMPEVVREYISTSSIIGAIDYQKNILESYKNDITKYSETNDAPKIISTFDSIPVQLAKENKKFQYKLIQKGGTSTIFGDSINWLVNAGIVNKCVKTKIGVPLKMYEELDSFKLYMNDVGLLTNLSQFPIYLIKNREAVNETMIGMLTENYVASSFKYNNLNLNYWRSDYDSEIDFVLQSEKGLIIPVEVKTSIHTKSRSLNVYMNEFNPSYAVRISSKNFGFKNNIKSVPLYATFCIDKKSLDNK